MNIFVENIDTSRYFIVTYFIESKTNLRDSAWALAMGQSVGNPNFRSVWETEELFAEHSCLIINDEDWLKRNKSGIVKVGFPTKNIDFKTDGVSHLLSNIMGGQLDIDIIDKCHILDLEINNDIIDSDFNKPKYGITGIRQFTNAYNRPLLGSIIKPKTGISKYVILDIVKELVDGGVDFIKEDEILSNPAFCRLEDRIEYIFNYLDGKNVVYCASITSDPIHLIDRVKLVHSLGGNGVHVNFWSGLGSYKSIRDLDLPIFLHFQKSGDKIFTNRNHNFYIDWIVISKLAAYMGVDFIHSGMIGGYYKWPEDETIDSVKILNSLNVMPTLSCGFNPALTQMVTDKVGIDYVANVGGWVHSHPSGTKSGVSEMKKSINTLR